MKELIISQSSQKPIEKIKLSNLQKMVMMLRLLNQSPYKYSALEISSITGINRTTVYRTLKILAEQDFIIQDELTRKFSIGPMLYHIGQGYLNNYTFKEEIYRILEEIVDITTESVGVAVREGRQIISLYDIDVEKPLKMNNPAGSYYPMNRGCFGKLLMAYYDRDTVNKMLDEQTFEKLYPNTLTEKEDILQEYKKIRNKGFVISDGEAYSQLAAGVGVPVYNEREKVTACIAISFIKDENFDEKKDSFIKILLEYSEKLKIYMP